MLLPQHVNLIKWELVPAYLTEACEVYPPLHFLSFLFSLKLVVYFGKGLKAGVLRLEKTGAV